MRRLLGSLLLALAACASAPPAAPPRAAAEPPVDPGEARDPEALFGAGLAAKQAGRAAEATRLFAAARAKLAALTGEPVHVEATGGFDGPPVDLACAGGLCAAAHGNVVSVIDVASFRERLRLEGHEDAVVAVALAADGRSLVSASRDGSARLWDARTGALVRKLWGHAKAVRAVAISPDGQTIATGSDDGTVRLWGPSSGAERHVLRGHQDDVRCVAISPDGALVASGAEDGRVRLWEARTGALRRELGGRDDGRRAVAFSPDGKTLLAMGWRGHAQLWDVATGAAQPALDVGEPLAFSPDGRTILSGSSARRFDLALGQRVEPFQGYTREVTGIAFRADGQAFFTANQEAWAIEEWDFATGRALRRLGARASSMRAVAFDPRGALLAARSDAGTALVFPLDGRGEPRRLVDDAPWKAPYGAPELTGSIAFSPDGATLAWTSSDGAVRLWTVGPSPTVRRLDHWYEVTALAFRPGSAELATIAEHTARIHDLAEGGRRAEIVLPFAFEARRSSWDRPSPTLLAYTPDGGSLAAGGSTALALWHAEAGTLRAEITGDEQIRVLAFHPGAPILATGHEDGTLRVRDVPSWAPPRFLRAHEKPLTALAFGHDGKLIATGSKDGTVRFFDGTTGTPCGRPLVHPHPVESLAFRPGGALLATSDGRALRLWSVATGALLIELGAAPRGGTYALTPGRDARLEIEGDGPRDLFACRAGPWTFPLDLCEEPSRAADLLRRTLAGARAERAP
jgi:WD40 repeat protein